ncbi:hypothetical protein HY029_02365 [Candidatus Gottesmanbacteria bacterium]|nr:hypothetical protein [Candidatus Gottesmanbacteria bacterium]
MPRFGQYDSHSNDQKSHSINKDALVEVLRLARLSTRAIPAAFDSLKQSIMCHVIAAVLETLPKDKASSLARLIMTWPVDISALTQWIEREGIFHDPALQKVVSRAFDVAMDDAADTLGPILAANRKIIHAPNT